MAQIDPKDITSIIKDGAKVGQAAFGEVRATFTGHQKLEFSSPKVTGVIPGTWLQYNVPRLVLNQFTYETALVSYASVITHRQKRALMGVEKGERKSGGAADSANAEALEKRYRELLTDKFTKSEPVLKSTKELHDLHNTSRTLKEKAEKLHSESELKYDKAKSPKAKNSATGIMADSERMRTEVYLLEEQAQKLEESINKSIKNRVFHSLSEVRPNPGGKVDVAAIKKAIQENVTSDIDNGLVATVCPIKFKWTICKIDGETLTKRMEKLKNKVEADYDKAWTALHSETYKSLTAKRVADSDKLQKQCSALIGVVNNQRETDAGGNTDTSIPMDKVTVDGVQQNLDGRLTSLLKSERLLWEKRVANIKAVEAAKVEVDSQLNDQTITDFTVETSSTLGGLSKKVKRRYLDSKITVEIDPIAGSTDSAKGAKVKVTIRQVDTAHFGTFWTEEDVSDAAIEFKPDGTFEGLNDLGNFMVRHMASA